jgi:hypothetical protein
VCHACMTQSNHDPMQSIFYQDTPGEDFMGRMMYPCPRCTSTNTRSFHSLQKDGSTQQLFGLERIVRQHPRSAFVVKAAKAAAV